MAGRRTDTAVKPKTRSNRRERGQSMVEFALVLPLFLIVMFIIADFGVGFSRWLVITNATREGAREGTVGASMQEVKERTASTSNGLLDSAGVAVSYEDFDSDGVGPGDAVAVSADYEYNLITPLGKFLDLAFGSLTLSSCADMRLELDVEGAVGGGSGC